MEQKEILKIYNKFNRIHNQYSLVQRNFVFDTQDLPIRTIPNDKERKFNVFYEAFEDEFKTPTKYKEICFKCC